LYRIGQDNQ